MYLTQLYYKLRSGTAGFQSMCNLGEKMNCDVVANSKWAELVPGLPLSSVVAGWFVALLLLTLMARAGLVTAAGLAAKRRYAIVIMFAVAAVLTPPDGISQVSLAVPMEDGIGKGLGKDLTVYVKIQPATLLRISSRPMNTTTTVSTGARSTGRIRMRSNGFSPARYSLESGGRS